jgi:hypothetical protein
MLCTIDQMCSDSFACLAEYTEQNVIEHGAGGSELWATVRSASPSCVMNIEFSVSEYHPAHSKLENSKTEAAHLYSVSLYYFLRAPSGVWLCSTAESGMLIRHVSFILMSLRGSTL